MIKKEEFIKLIDKYYPMMSYYQLVQLYFKIVDGSNPYFYEKDYCNNVFDKVHPKHHTYSSCCSLHQNRLKLQKIMKIKLSRTNHEKKIYKRACNFFKNLNLSVIINCDKNIEDYNNLQDWDFISKNFRIKRNGRLFWILDNKISHDLKLL